MSNDALSPITTETRLSMPLNGTIYTTTRKVANEKLTPLVGATMEAEGGPAWADSRIIAVNVIPLPTGNQLQIIHARIPSEADQLPSNWEYSTCSLNGRQYPSVSRTVVVLASAVAHDTPAIGTAMPFEVGSIFTGKGYILADRQAVKSGLQLEPVFRVERREFIIRTTRKNIGVDSLNGKPLWSETTFYYTGQIVPNSITVNTTTVDALFAAPTNAYWGLQADGTQRTGERISCAWFSITTELVVGGTFVDGVVAVDTYQTNENYSWPPVLFFYELFPWGRRDGGTDASPTVIFKPEAYSGPCLSNVTRTWSNVPFTTIVKVDQMLPKRINFTCPLFNLNIEACLHPYRKIEVIIGTGDPTYKLAENFAEFLATNYTDWPDTIRAYDDQEPFRGGFLRTVRVISKPS